MDLRFKPILKLTDYKLSYKLTDYKLPFKLTNADLNSWLHALPSGDSYTSCYDILCVLQNLNAVNIKVEARLSFLQKINASLSVHAERLEATFLDSGYPLTSVEQDNVEIIVWCYSELAINFQKILNNYKNPEKILNNKLIAWMLYQVVMHMGQAYLYMSEVYAQPFHGFWKSFYKVFEFAEKMKLLNVKVSSEGLEQNTINNVCKKILVFELCDSNQFRPREMKKIYHFLGNIVDCVEVFKNNQQENRKGLCAFNLSEDSPPEDLTDNTEIDGRFIRYIDTVIVAKNINQFIQRGSLGQGALKSINEALFFRLIRTLGMAHKRKFTRITEDRTCSGVVGIKNVINWLGKSQSFDLEGFNENAADLNKVSGYDPRTSGGWGELDVGLVPHEDVVLHQMHEMKKFELRGNEQIKKIFAAAPVHAIDVDKGIWNNSEAAMKRAIDPVSCENFEIRDSSIKGYSMIWDAMKINAKIGDILGVVTDFGSRVEIGLIRRINTLSEENIQLGVELLGMKSELVHMCRPGHKGSGTWALLLPGEEALQIAESVVFDSSEYLPGEFVCLQRGAKEVRCRLNKLLHSTSAVNHIELFYPKTDENQTELSSINLEP